MTAMSQNRLPPGTQANDVRSTSATDMQRLRFEHDATRILEGDLHRMRWTVKDRDAVAASIAVIVARERRILG